MQLVNGEGVFDRNGIMQHMTETGVSGNAWDYRVVAIIGTHASGKSTLMNKLVKPWS